MRLELSRVGLLAELANHYTTRGAPRGVMVKAMNCGIVVREFVLQSRYYVHFRANTLGKGMNPLILPPAMGKQQDGLGSSALVRQLVQEKENSEFKPVKLRLKTDLVSYPARAEGLVNSTRGAPFTGLYKSSCACMYVCINPSTHFWRCPWCRRYRRWKWTRRHEFKSWTRLIAFHIALIPLGKV